MSVHNCKLCGRVHHINPANTDLCPNCMMMHEAQYKVTLQRLQKHLQQKSLPQGGEPMGLSTERVMAYLDHRFGTSAQRLTLDALRRGHCYICTQRMYNPLEEACLNCLKQILTAVEAPPSAPPAEKDTFHDANTEVSPTRPQSRFAPLNRAAKTRPQPY